MSVSIISFAAGFLLIIINYLIIHKIYEVMVGFLLKSPSEKVSGTFLKSKPLCLTFMVFFGGFKLIAILLFLHLTLNVLSFPLWPFVYGSFLALVGIIASIFIFFKKIEVISKIFARHSFRGP